MPNKQKTQSKDTFIVDSFAKAEDIDNKRYASEVFDKYSLCNPKYVKTSQIKHYILYKLKNKIDEIKRNKKQLTDIINDKLMMDIWNVLCPIKENYDIMPDMLYGDIESIIRIKTAKYLKRNAKKKKLVNKQLESSDNDNSDSELEDNESDDNESDDNKSESDEEDIVKVKKATIKPTKTTKTTKSFKTINIKKKKHKSESSESDLDSD